MGLDRRRPNWHTRFSLDSHGAAPRVEGRDDRTGFTKLLARELSSAGVLGEVTPAGIAGTDIMGGQMPSAEMRATTIPPPIGWLPQPAPVAAMVARLSSVELSFSSGAVFDIAVGGSTD